jgi:hypothetical protein
MAALAAVVAVVPASSVGAGRPVVKSESAHLRAWTVTITYRLAGGDPFSLHEIHVRADIGRATTLDRDIPLTQPCRDARCEIVGARSFQVLDLGGGAPTAVLWLWTGGAHCCVIALTVSLAGGAVALHDFGNPGAQIIKVGGQTLFRSADDRFSYLYTSYAESGAPVQIWLLRSGGFVNVTASYLSRISNDARRYWALTQTYVRRKVDIRGLFAAWAADACRLSGRARVEAAARPFVAAGDFSPPRTDPFGPTGKRFPVVLVRDLTRFGYCRKP